MDELVYGIVVTNFATFNFSAPAKCRRKLKNFIDKIESDVVFSYCNNNFATILPKDIELVGVFYNNVGVGFRYTPYSEINDLFGTKYIPNRYPSGSYSETVTKYDLNNK